MNKKISLNITKIIMLLTLMIESSSVVYAEDANKIKKCSMMSGIVANIVDDRNSGMTYKSRIAKNKEISIGTNTAMLELLTNMTNVAYKELKSRPKLEITNSTFYACMQSDS